MSASETVTSYCSGDCNGTSTFEVLVPDKKYRCITCRSTSALC
jgi:hypothetical protein